MKLIQLRYLASHLEPRLVQRAESAESQEGVDREFAGIKVPFLR
jgi:hypothetical protein